MKRLIALLLSAVMLLAFAACGNGQNSNADDNSDAGESSKADASLPGTEIPDEEFVLFSNLPEVTYSDQVVKFLVEGDYMDTYASVEVMPHTNSSSTLQQAVKDRNDLVEEKFRVTIEEFRTSSSGEMLSTLRENATAGINEYDVVMPYIPNAATLSQEGYLTDLRKLENIHLDMPYYDQGSVKDLSICGKNYFVTGDLTLLAADVTHVLLFNKDVVTNNRLESPYDLVESGRWTIDKLHEMAKFITAQTDDMTEWTHMDTYGFLVNSNFISSMFIGAGERFTSKDNQDKPIVSVYSESAVSTFDKIYNLVNDITATGQIDNMSREFGSTAVADGKTVWVAATEAIASGRCLFRAVSLNAILALGEYDCNFGVLPAPMLNEQQDRYYCRVSTIYASCIAIPTNVKDAEMSSIIADAMMQASTNTSKEAYIEVIMKNRKIQDDESAEILDLIFESRVYDFGTVFNWGGASEGDVNSITGFMNNIAFQSGSNTFVSTWETNASGVQTAMDETVDKYLSLE